MSTKKYPAHRVGVSAFFPAYNDAPTLPALIRRAFEVLEQEVDDFEVIVVNDGSQDNTTEVLAALQQQFGPRLRVVTHPENRGYGGALQTGFASATKDLIFYTDGDGQYDVAEVALLLAEMKPGIGLVNGYKVQRNDPWHRILIGTIYNQFARTIFGIHLRDIDCDFRLVRRELVRKIRLTCTSGTICVELVKKIELSGCGVVQVAVHHYPRLHGRSQFFRIRSLCTTLVQLSALWFSTVVMRTIPHAIAAPNADPTHKPATGD